MVGLLKTRALNPVESIRDFPGLTKISYYGRSLVVDSLADLANISKRQILMRFSPISARMS